MMKLSLDEYNQLIKKYNVILNSGDVEKINGLEDDYIFMCIKNEFYTRIRCQCYRNYSDNCQGYIFIIGKVDHPNRLFCNECRKHRRKISVEKYKEKQIKVDLKKICPICNQEFTPKRASRKTCSDICRKKASLGKIKLDTGMTRTQLKAIEKIKSDIQKWENYRLNIPNWFSKEETQKTALKEANEAISKLHNKLRELSQ